MAKKLTTIAKNLRRRSTDAEKLLWRHLRSKQLKGLKFRRQHPIGSYIVDFACLDKQVVIELDGGQHTVNGNRDKERDRRLEKEGYKVLRFWNNDVLRNTNGVLEVIRENCLPHPPLKGGER
ncbi:MAG TPA: endonuclease domain-containing protein [Candidatus Avalokitesvara rifleensis]|uniref:endonuclease domain-containing protein n=1 Tax=Candidatus Avalokitesvara rifleensis TaxID=3367620 RepID=UPI002712C5E4|nr:endonuclease domain-containing protein [Candidatus Brocadiales bacterium]